MLKCFAKTMKATEQMEFDGFHYLLNWVLLFAERKRVIIIAYFSSFLNARRRGSFSHGMVTDGNPMA